MRPQTSVQRCRHTLTSRHNLAAAYESVGRVAEAITLFEQVVADRERVLGVDHPDTLNSRHALAALRKRLPPDDQGV